MEGKSLKEIFSDPRMIFLAIAVVFVILAVGASKLKPTNQANQANVMSTIPMKEEVKSR